MAVNILYLGTQPSRGFDIYKQLEEARFIDGNFDAVIFEFHYSALENFDVKDEDRLRDLVNSVKERNPHFVFFEDDLDAELIEVIGKEITKINNRRTKNRISLYAADKEVLFNDGVVGLEGNSDGERLDFFKERILYFGKS